MEVRHPPGRAGRPWLAHHLEVARRGAELLAQKRAALVREHARLEPLLATARSEWQRCAREAERWLTRAAMLQGERPLDFVPAAPGASAQVTVSWRTILGLSCPEDAQLQMPADRQLVPAGASAALYCAAAAHRRALAAAVNVAVLERAFGAIRTELNATTLRCAAIEHRWIPAHEQALKALELALDEIEREDSARVRRATTRGGSPSP